MRTSFIWISKVLAMMIAGNFLIAYPALSIVVAVMTFLHQDHLYQGLTQRLRERISGKTFIFSEGPASSKTYQTAVGGAGTRQTVKDVCDSALFQVSNKTEGPIAFVTESDNLNPDGLGVNGNQRNMRNSDKNMPVLVFASDFGHFENSDKYALTSGGSNGLLRWLNWYVIAPLVIKLATMCSKYSLQVAKGVMSFWVYTCTNNILVFHDDLSLDEYSGVTELCAKISEDVAMNKYPDWVATYAKLQETAKLVVRHYGGRPVLVLIVHKDAIKPGSVTHYYTFTQNELCGLYHAEGSEVVSLK